MRRAARLAGLALAAGAAPLSAQAAGPSVSFGAGAIPAACADSTVPPADRRDPGSYRPVQRRAIAVPSLTTDAEPRSRVQVEFLVNARGTVDSVTIHGDLRADVRAKLRATLLTHTFWPAVYQGCAVPGRMAIELAFE